MRIDDSVIKNLGEDVWLHYIASGYKVKMNRQTVDILRSMLSRPGPEKMSDDEKFIYEKLLAKGIAGPDTGREEDRSLPVFGKSLLESVEIELSGKCNLRCSHCFSALSQMNMGETLIDKIFSGIDELEPVNLTINGGEPLMNPALMSVIEKARKRHLRIILMTNAVLMTSDIASFLKANKVAKAVVSLDFFEETHDLIRGAGSFRKAVEGIRLMVSEKVPVFVTAMVLESTIGRVEEFKNFCLGELGASGVRFSSIMPIGRASENLNLALSAASVRRLHDSGQLSVDNGEETTFSRLSGARRFDCNAGVGQCFISADGIVYACHYFQNIGETMGNLAGSSLPKIYQSFANSDSIAVNFDWMKLEKCRKCPCAASCRGGCRARARVMSGDWNGPDPYSCLIYGQDAY